MFCVNLALSKMMLPNIVIKGTRLGYHDLTEKNEISKISFAFKERR